MYVNKKIGERWLQIAGGLMMTIGIGVTAFSTEAWQALLATSVLGGTLKSIALDMFKVLFIINSIMLQ